MYLTFLCPNCESPQQSEDLSKSLKLSCDCGWEYDVHPDAIVDGRPTDCLRCGNEDLWRQKNFPQWLGLIFVATGAITSGIAWYYHRPVLALSILVGFGILDMVLYSIMPDVLVCYRCRSRHHRADVSKHGAYDHELGERYRQERIRLEQSQSETPVPSDDHVS